MTTEWILGIIATVLAGIVLAALIAVAVHVSNSDKHPKKDDVVFRDVCDSEMRGQRDCLESEIKNLKEAIAKLEDAITNGFSNITNQIANLKK